MIILQNFYCLECNGSLEVVHGSGCKCVDCHRLFKF
jgi:hypothetical protein